MDERRQTGPRAEAAERRLGRLRSRIDRLDAEILERLSDRYRVVEQIQQVKQERGDGVWIPARERAQLERLRRLNRRFERPLPEAALDAIFGEILSASRALQGGVRVAFLGPEGTFSERAARRHFGSSAELVSVASIGDVFEAVERERARYGVVPIENSTEGMVGQTLDHLVTSPLRIVGERQIAVRHALLGRARSLGGVRRVVSHAQSLAQCRAWLRSHLRHVPTAEVSSNAAAAAVAARSPTTAAIAPREVAGLYDLRVLADGIQDLARNVTRFVVIAATEIEDAAGCDKVSILFSVRNEAGRLFRALEPLARERIDLCKIESRPMRGRAWEYVFFTDFRGRLGEPRVRAALRAMERRCTWFKVLGAYPEARAA